MEKAIAQREAYFLLSDYYTRWLEMMARMGSLEPSLGDGHGRSARSTGKTQEEGRRHCPANASPAFSKQSQQHREEGLPKDALMLSIFQKQIRPSKEDDLEGGPGTRD